jgi:hypothetical protein
MLVRCALVGEGLGAGGAHPDNIAPAICGGFVLVRHPNPPDIIRLPVPAGLTAVVVQPDIEIETARARALLGTTVPLADAVRQWANLGAFVHGLHASDFDLISRSLEDSIAEPAARRSCRAWRPSSARRPPPRAGEQPVKVGTIDLRALPRPRDRRARGRSHDGRSAAGNRRVVADLRLVDFHARRVRRKRMRFVSTRGQASAASLGTALFDGLAPDGGLYVPDSIEAWSADEIASLTSRSLPELGLRVLQPFAAGAIDAATLSAVVYESLDFPIPLIEVEPGIFALELFHGPTLAFKDVGARVMARLMAALGADVTVLTATSGDRQRRGNAVPRHRQRARRDSVSGGPREPDQEAQLTMFNDDAASNVRAHAVAGSFDDCQKLVKDAFADTSLRRQIP